jgi:hypothetical protein
VPKQASRLGKCETLVEVSWAFADAKALGLLAWDHGAMATLPSPMKATTAPRFFFAFSFGA